MKEKNLFNGDAFVTYELGNPKLTHLLTILQRITNSNLGNAKSEEEVITQLEKEVNLIYSNHLTKTKKEQGLLSLTSQVLEGKSISQFIDKPEFEDNLDAIQSGILKIIEKNKIQNSKNILFRDIFHAISISFCIYNPLNRTIGAYNKSFNTFFNLENEHTDVLSSYSIFDEELKRKLDDFYLSDEKNAQFEVVFGGKVSKKGLVQLNKIKTIDDETPNIILFITDLSHQIENEIIKKEKKLVEKNLDLKNTFITYFSNEIVLPLYKIISSLTNPEISKLLDHQHRIDLQTLKYQCQSINVLIDDVLNDAILEKYKDSRSLQEINLMNLIQEVITTHYFHAISKNVFIDFEIDLRIPKIITIDSVKLSIILNNLIGSSLKLIAKDSKIILKVNFTEEEPQKLLFEVVSLDKQSNEINPLQSTHNPNISGVDTYGLGLPISEKLVEYLGGKLEFIEQENKYTFQLSL